jgi:hypothetical protein
MNNCIILSGQYRTFERTKENIKAFIDLNALDVYCHLWSNDEKEVNDIKETLQPKNILVEEYSYYEEYFKSIEYSIRKTNPKPSTMDVLCNHASMNFSRQRAFELVDGVYDNFVYCRYDLDIYSNFKIESIENSVFVPYEESYNLISDIFCISPMHYAKHYFLFDSFQRLHSSDFEDSFVNFLDSTKNTVRKISEYIEKKDIVLI